MLGWLVTVVLLAYAGARALLGYPPRRGHRRLAPRDVACLQAAAEALFPPGGAIPTSGAEADVAGYVDRMVDASHPRTRRLMRLLFVLVEHATLVFPAPGGLKGFRRFSSLDLAQRVAVLEAWRTSRLFPRRLVFTSLRTLFTLGYFAHPPVLRQLRLAPLEIETPVCGADLLYPRIGTHPDSIEFTEADLTAPSDGTPLPLDAPLLAGYREESR